MESLDPQMVGGEPSYTKKMLQGASERLALHASAATLPAHFRYITRDMLASAARGELSNIDWASSQDAGNVDSLKGPHGGPAGSEQPPDLVVLTSNQGIAGSLQTGESSKSNDGDRSVLIVEPTAELDEHEIKNLDCLAKTEEPSGDAETPLGSLGSGDVAAGAGDGRAGFGLAAGLVIAAVIGVLIGMVVSWLLMSST